MRQLFFVAMGALLIWGIVGVWVSNFSTSSEWWFSVQSVDEEQLVACPWSDLLWSWSFEMIHPLVDKAEPIIAFRQWVRVEQFEQSWPSLIQPDRTARLPDVSIDTVKAIIGFDWKPTCVYSSDLEEYIHLVGAGLSWCTTVNTSSSVGFKCK